MEKGPEQEFLQFLFLPTFHKTGCAILRHVSLCLASPQLGGGGSPGRKESQFVITEVPRLKVRTALLWGVQLEVPHFPAVQSTGLQYAVLVLTKQFTFGMVQPK